MLRSPQNTDKLRDAENCEGQVSLLYFDSSTCRELYISHIHIIFMQLFLILFTCIVSIAEAWHFLTKYQDLK